MQSANRDFLVLLNAEWLDETSINRELQQLQKILCTLDYTDVFCKANELVDRNQITQNRKKILKQTRYSRMNSFRFLINKN